MRLASDEVCWVWQGRCEVVGRDGKTQLNYEDKIKDDLVFEILLRKAQVSN